jgi:acetyl esterase/lipase
MPDTPRRLRLIAFHLLLPAALLAAVLAPALRAPAQAPQSAPPDWTAHAGTRYAVLTNLTYLTASNVPLKLDVYFPEKSPGVFPALIYFHGGGWVFGNKESNVMHLLPYFEMGWTVVIVQYRLANVSLAPAAVEDCRCALRWVLRNAEKFKVDTRRIVLSGHSAGGHLALITALLPESAGLDRQCPAGFGSPADVPRAEPRVAAVVNWFGITDVNDLLGGPNEQGYATAWFGSLKNREELARAVSPLTYVRAGAPPVVTIHGDADKLVPYSHAVRLHAALEKAGVANELHTIPRGDHGGFTAEENAAAFRAIRAFLKKHGIL